MVPHDGVCAGGSEGNIYWTFEMFRMHPENERIVFHLKSLSAAGNYLYGYFNFYAAITWLYYKESTRWRNFMTEKWGRSLRLPIKVGQNLR